MSEKKKKTVTQPYLDKKMLTSIFKWFCLIFALSLMLIWAKQKFLNIYIDWTLVLPVISLFSTLLPVGLSIRSWLQGKIDRLEQRVDEIEPVIIALKELIETNRDQDIEISKHLLRLESKIVSTRQMLEDLRIGEQFNRNRRILRNKRKNNDIKN